MYIFPDMIDLGLKEGQDWPSDDHRKVAQNLALGNKNVIKRDDLKSIVQEVINIPNSKIRTITLRELPIASQFQ